MKDLLLALLDLAVTVARLCRPGGVRAVISENLLLKQLGVHHGDVDGANLCRMFNEAIRGHGPPRHLSTDHDPLFEAHRWAANLRVLEIDEIKDRASRADVTPVCGAAHWDGAARISRPRAVLERA